MISGWLYRSVYLSSKRVKKHVIKESKNEYILIDKRNYNNEYL